MQFLIHDPLTRVLAQIVAIVVVARLIGRVMRRLHQPMVIAEVIAGILLGPSFLGWVAPDVFGAFFPSNSLPVLQTVSLIGLLLFMFIIGMELDFGLLRGRGRTSFVVSNSSIAVPFLLGTLLAVELFAEFSGPGVSLPVFCLFMGSAMSVTAFPVLARILAEQSLLRTREGALAIACAALNDITAWCVLAFVVAMVRSSGWSSAFATTLVAAVYVVVMWRGVRPLIAKLDDRLNAAGLVSHDVIAAVLVLALLSAWATELIGVHALFGAFVFGAILPRGILTRTLMERLEALVVVILLPLFFAYSGLRTQIGLLASASDWIACAAIIMAACVGKFGGTTVAARATGSDWREATALGVLMNTRGLMELIVLNIGLDLGVLSPRLFTMMVLMALGTTFMTTPLLRAILGRRR